MIPELTADLRKQVTAAEADLRRRSFAHMLGATWADTPADQQWSDLPPELTWDDLGSFDDKTRAWAVGLRAEYEAAFAAGRTALSWSEWRDGEIAQGAVAWVLGAVFVRFCEDNDLVAGRWIAGRGEGLRLAVDAESAFYAADPRRGTADWLREAFGHLADLPATGGVFDREHSLVWSVPLGDDLCRTILGYWRQTGPDGQPLRALNSTTLDTRFLGDLYQDLSALAKKKYALLQTPEFVEEFILGRTLTPALDEFGLPGLRLIDPTCGSGHFLLGAFDRLLAEWQAREPGAPAGENVRRALDSVHGVDINPFAAAIARFRLVVAALRAAGYRRLADAPAYDLHLAVGDSLLDGAAQGALFDVTGAATFHYRNEDVHEHRGILQPGRYHVVVGNPPYITVKDPALNEAYRGLYSTCKGKYALSVPFMELFFQLAVRGTADTAAGFVGQITSNSFMKREFGSKVIETLLSGTDPLNPVDLLDVIDTSGAYIPGHGTPTVILVARRRRPVAATVRAVLGVRGEPGQPENPAKGLVWTEIVEHLDQPGFDGTYMSVTDMYRDALKAHPWSLNGGGAGDVKEAMESAAPQRVGALVFRIGFFGIQANDEAYLYDGATVQRRGLEAMKLESAGETVRDYVAGDFAMTFFPYSAEHDLLPLETFPNAFRAMWPMRTDLGNRATFSRGTYFTDGRPWYEWHQLPKDEDAHTWSLAFAFVATHNHVVLDRGERIFHRSAPVIKLPAGASEDDHLALLGVLNSSAACFWLKQVSYPKGGDPIGQDGARVSQQPWSDRYEFTGTKLQEFPLPRVLPLAYGRGVDSLAQSLAAVTPSGICATEAPTRVRLAGAQREHARIRSRMIALQEELDWSVYHSYGLIDESLTMPTLDDVPGIALGQRAFEVALARRVTAGEEETAWFARHGSVPITVLPADWPEDYRDLIERRLDAIASNKAIRLLERPEFKRRWSSEPWDAMVTKAVGAWILDRLEDSALWSDAQGPRVQSVARLAAALRHDQALLEAARVLTGAEDPDLPAVLASLVADQAVPFLAAYRYTHAGLRKRAEWESVWALQRREDAGEKVTIPVPPKYTNKDFQRQSFWQARGKLDVPKERFISYPDAQPGADASLVVGWAGWDHAEQARALARLLVERVNGEGWGADRATPLLAGLVELEPWLFQWHDEPTPGFQASPAQAIRGLLDQRLAGFGLTRADVARWVPPTPVRGRRPKG